MSTRYLIWIVVIFGGLMAMTCQPTTSPMDPNTDGGVTCSASGLPDSDGDGIADIHEGSGATDTDRDGTPDILDDDSDGDGILDSIEAGREDCSEDPIDSDSDSTPDFQDVDSDDNGIRDDAESMEDSDSDGTEDWRDLDDDGDHINDDIEIGPDPVDPADSDGDAIDDYHDVDSDDDGINDEVEGVSDPDRDGLQNFRDPDSDGDGIDDAIEGTGDCDGDGTPNFLDLDSDSDGLADGVERTLGTDACNKDSDGDTLTDLVEVAVGTNPTDASSTIGEDEYFVILNYNDPAVVEELEFASNVKQADVYFLIDTTGSMSGALSAIRSGLSTFIVPEVADVVRDVNFGVGRFDDIPVSPFGGSTDVAYEHVHDISGEIASVQAALEDFGTGGGADGSESDVVALYCTATGDGVSTYVEPGPGCLEGRFGYPCFRPYSLPIILLFTDNTFHNGPPDGMYDPYNLPEVPNWLDAISVLNDIGAKVLTFNTSGGSVLPGEHLEATSVATGAVLDDGTPLIFDLSWSGEGLDLAVVDAISDLSSQISRDVNTTTEESPLVDDGIDAANFIKSVVPLSADPSVGVESFDSETFYGVEAGTMLTFTVTLQNDFVEETQEPQVFVARIVVLGDNTVRLDDRRVIILVPPTDVIIE